MCAAEEMLRHQESSILVAYDGHGFPENHPSISALASNAGCVCRWCAPRHVARTTAHVHKPRVGVHPPAAASASCRCVRLLSPLTRYGDAVNAEKAFRAAVAQAKYEGSLPAFHNLALYYAVQGRLNDAMAVVYEGMEALEWRAAHADPWDAPTHRPVYQRVRDDLVRLGRSIPLYAGWMNMWVAQQPVVGADAQERLYKLGFECMQELVAW
ncbi:hypothetical protein EON66_06685 [archaeon]|nr:MAG: hypothetical protein EON66_06685 [archaeon]